MPDPFWSCAESRSNEALTDQNAILSAMDTAKTRIGSVLSLILVMHDLHRVPNHSTCDACASHLPAGQQNGFGANKKFPLDGVVFIWTRLSERWSKFLFARQATPQVSTEVLAESPMCTFGAPSRPAG